jgi:glutamate dehydrogenase
VLRTSDSADAGERIAAWQQGAEEGTTRVLATLDEIMAAEHSSLATISVALRMLRTLVYQNVD